MKEDRIKEYLDTINIPSLTADEIQSIEENGSKFHKRIFVSGSITNPACIVQYADS
jgi:hypothetical protein